MIKCNRCKTDFDCDDCVKGDVCPNKAKVSELVELFSNKVCGYPLDSSLTCRSYINKSRLKSVEEMLGVEQ
jgi:hypothetical protein